MNESSNGSDPRRALSVQTGLAVALFGGFAVTMAACPGPTPHTTTDGSGGGGSSSTSTSTSSSSSSSSSSTATSSSSGGVQCMLAGDCPVPGSKCQIPVCEGSTCGFAPVEGNPKCSENGGTVCDDAGKCVACVTNEQCTPANFIPCMNGSYTAPPVCKNGACETNASENCGAKGLICKPGGCVSCSGDGDCGPPDVDCVVRHCNSGKCENTSVPQGSSVCLPPMMGTCSAAGTCFTGKYVFVTTDFYAPNFGSAKLADDQCNMLADAAGLGGTWMSWISDGGSLLPPQMLPSTPFTRFTKNPDPYLLLDDVTVVAMGWEGLKSGTLLNGITLDQQQQPVVSPLAVWTGTKSDGTYAGSSCGNWGGNQVGLTAAAGIAGDPNGGWTQQQQPLLCSSKAHLYCFQQ
jgi:hypothetical protein